MKKHINFSNILTLALSLGAILFFLYQKGYIFANFEHISPKEAFKLLDNKDTVFLDVRTYQEIKEEGKIPGSIHIPLDMLAQKIDMLKQYKDKKIVVYCRSGNRSVSASRLLSSLGFNVYNMQGGINEWKEEGLPVQKE